MCPRSIRCWHVWGWILLAVSPFSAGGCTPTEGGPRTSLYEVQHVQPDHWPADLADMAEKLRTRIAMLDENPAQGKVSQELTDLVGWAAEVAADTDLTEVQWLPIYQRSEMLRRSLRAARYAWTDSNLERAADLAEQIERAAGQLPAGGVVAWPGELPEEAPAETHPTRRPGSGETDEESSPASTGGEATASGTGGDDA